MTNAKEATRIKIASEQEALQLRLRVVELENAVNSRTNEVEVLRRENSRLESSFQKQQKDVSRKQKKHLSVFFINISYLNNTTNFNYFSHN
jgi:predicted nuclease with TOPRIM domain|tara:strand:+ start:55 stop:327 length:273 start_codon:yes stop_codon:yes gene_type:complete